MIMSIKVYLAYDCIFLFVSFRVQLLLTYLVCCNDFLQNNHKCAHFQTGSCLNVCFSLLLQSWTMASTVKSHSYLQQRAYTVFVSYPGLRDNIYQSVRRPAVMMPTKYQDFSPVDATGFQLIEKPIWTVSSDRFPCRWRIMWLFLSF